MDAYFVTGTCCAGKDYYIEHRWPEVDTIHVGLFLRTCFNDVLRKFTAICDRPSSPKALDSLVYKLVSDFMVENKRDGDIVSVVNGFPRHIAQLDQMEEICDKYKIAPHIVFIDAPWSVRMLRATMEDEGKNRARRVEDGEIEVYELWGNIMERESRYQSVTHIFGGKNVTAKSYAKGLLGGD